MNKDTMSNEPKKDIGEKIVKKRNRVIKTDFDIITYNAKKYVVFKLNTKIINKKLFIVDYEEFDRIKDYNFRLNSNYVRVTLKDEEEKYLQNIILQGGDKKLVIFLDKIQNDLRKENLKLIDYSEQKKYQNKIKRKIVLPDEKKINVDDIPRHVNYDSGSAGGGELFRVVINNLDGKGDNLKWTSSSYQNLSLRFKLEETKKLLRNIKEQYPDIIDSECIEYDNTQKTRELIDSYNEIIKLSKFSDLKECLAEYGTKNYIVEDLTNLTDFEIKLLRDPFVGSREFKYKHLITSLPSNSGVSKGMIPPYCQYIKKTDSKGEHFRMVHPIYGIHESSSAKNKTLIEKLNDFKIKIEKIESLK